MIGLAGLLWDPLAPAAAPKWAAMFLLALLLPAGAARRLSPAAMAFLLLAAWMGLRSPERLGWLAACAVLLLSLGRSVEDARDSATRAALIIGAGASVFAVVELASGSRWIHGGQGNPDWLGLVLAVALPFAVERARRDRRFLGLVAVEIGALLASRSRTAMVAAAVSLIVLHRKRWALPLIAVVVVLVVGLGTHALAGRAQIWRLSAEVALRHPLLGGGEFSAAFAQVQGEALRALPLGEACRRFVYTDSAHDDYLQLAAEAGLPALLLLLALLLTARRSFPAALSAIAVAALGDRPLAQPPIMILLALIVAACPSPAGGVVARLRPLVCAAGLALALPTWWAAHLCTRARDENPRDRAVTLALAERLDPRSGPIAFEAGLDAAERHDLAPAIAHFEESRRRFFQPATEVALGNARLENGELERARDVYVGLLQLQPGSLRARLNLAETLRRLGRSDEAEAEQEIAHRLWPALTERSASTQY